MITKTLIVSDYLVHPKRTILLLLVSLTGFVMAQETDPSSSKRSPPSVGAPPELVEAVVSGEVGWRVPNADMGFEVGKFHEIYMLPSGAYLVNYRVSTRQEAWILFENVSAYRIQLDWSAANRQEPWQHIYLSDPGIFRAMTDPGIRFLADTLHLDLAVFDATLKSLQIIGNAVDANPGLLEDEPIKKMCYQVAIVMYLARCIETDHRKPILFEPTSNKHILRPKPLEFNFITYDWFGNYLSQRYDSDFPQAVILPMILERAQNMR